MDPISLDNALVALADRASRADRTLAHEAVAVWFLGGVPNTCIFCGGVPAYCVLLCHQCLDVVGELDLILLAVLALELAHRKGRAVNYLVAGPTARAQPLKVLVCVFHDLSLPGLIDPVEESER